MQDPIEIVVRLPRQLPEGEQARLKRKLYGCVKSGTYRVPESTPIEVILLPGAEDGNGIALSLSYPEIETRHFGPAWHELASVFRHLASTLDTALHRQVT